MVVVGIVEVQAGWSGANWGEREVVTPPTASVVHSMVTENLWLV